MQHLIVHELPVAPNFIGRESELNLLREFWNSHTGVLSLVGLGGAGKTVMLHRFLAELLDSGTDAKILVWSFYDDPDTNAFLRTAVEFVSGKDVAQASGTGWFYVLKQGLESSTRYLFVLDGLERVQRPATDAQGIYGELEDPLLRGFLLRMAAPDSRSQAIITSRFPISDLESRGVHAYQIVDVDQLDVETGRYLLQAHGLSADKNTLDWVMNLVGSHALTLDLFGATIVRYFGGKAQNLPEEVLNLVPGEDSQSSRLVAVLSLIQQCLTKHELDLLNRLCVFRFGISVEELSSIFLRDKDAAGSLAGLDSQELQDLSQVLVDLHLVHLEKTGNYTVHPAVRDHFYRFFRDVMATHGAITEHLLSLTGRPGIGLPEAKESLDLLEELVHHALKAGRDHDAIDIYVTRLGGNEHLNVTLGDYSRTFRILSAFKDCPDDGAMYHCQRAFGQFGEALRSRPQNRYILVAQGRLSELRDDPHKTTRTVARFLQGDDVQLPMRLADFPMSAAHLRLFKGDVSEALSCAVQEAGACLFQDDLIRCRLAQGEALRHRGQTQDAEQVLEEAGRWSLTSGSHEHLYHTFVLRGKIAFDRSDYVHAASNLEEALQICQESDFALFEVLALAELSKIRLALGTLHEARRVADRAVSLAAEPNMRFVWGEMAGLRAIVNAAMAQGNTIASLKSLRRLLELQRSVNDASFLRTEKAMAQIANA